MGFVLGERILMLTNDITSAAILSSLLIILILVVLRNSILEWICTQITTSIQHEYDQKLETYKAQKRMQSEISQLVAVLMSLDLGYFFQITRILTLWGSIEWLNFVVAKVWSQSLRLNVVACA